MYLEPATELVRRFGEEATKADPNGDELDTKRVVEIVRSLHRMLYGTWQLVAADYDYHASCAQEEPRAAMYGSLTAVREPGGSVVQDIVNANFTHETIRASAKQAGSQQASFSPEDVEESVPGTEMGADEVLQIPTRETEEKNPSSDNITKSGQGIKRP